MRRKFLMWWLAAALVAGIGAQCESGDPHSGGGGPFPPPAEKPKDGRSTCPDIEFRSPDERCFTLQTFVSSRLGPYDVYINITGGTGAYPPHIPIAAGGWKHGVVYRTGVKMLVTMTLEHSKYDRDGFCSITDASNLAKDMVKPSRIDGSGPYIAVCVLHTSQ